MTYKLLALDLDGTLLRTDGEIHDADLASIERLAGAGIPTTIVTGRLSSGAQQAADHIRVVGPMACADGSHILDARTGEDHVHRALSGGHAATLREIAREHDVASFLFARDTIVHDERGASFAPFVSVWTTKVTAVDRVDEHPYWDDARGVLALVAVGPEDSVRRMEARLRVALGAAAFVFAFSVSRVPGMWAVIVRAAGATKGTAIHYLAKHHGCAPEDVVVVGDWLNDLPMFEVAGRSFAMAQAPDEVKAIATDLLLASGKTGGGVAEVIDRVWGIR